jgi:hypothetical protein
VLGVVAVVVTVVVVVLVLVLEVDDEVLVLLLGVDVFGVPVAVGEWLAGADECDVDELGVLEPPLASAYATAAPRRSSATTARKAHGPAPRERRGGTARVGAVGSGGAWVAGCGTVAICGTSAAAAATAIISSAAGSGLVGAVAASS